MLRVLRKEGIESETAQRLVIPMCLRPPLRVCGSVCLLSTAKYIRRLGVLLPFWAAAQHSRRDSTLWIPHSCVHVLQDMSRTIHFVLDVRIGDVFRWRAEMKLLARTTLSPLQQGRSAAHTGLSSTNNDDIDINDQSPVEHVMVFLHSGAHVAGETR